MRRRQAPVEPSTLEALIIRSPNGRCGTTLLMQLLATSNEIAFDRVMPFEHRYLSYLLHATSNMGRRHEGDTSGWSLDVMLSGSTRELGPMPFDATSIDVGDFGTRALRAMWQALADALTAKRGTPPRYYAEKYSHELDRLTEAGIGVREIWVMRDPRDVFASIRSFDTKRGYYGFGRTPGEADESYLERFAAGVKAHVERMPEDGRVVRYEDMVSDLGGVAAGIGRWLGVDLNARAVERRRILRRGHMTSGSVGASVGRWRGDLTEKESARIGEILAGELGRFAYER